MLTMSQGRRQNTAAGEPIYCPFNIVNVNEIWPRKGQLALFAAGPGTGKSALILFWIMKGLKDRRNSVFYFSADSDAYTQWKRAAAIETGYDQSEIDRLMRTGKPAEVEALEARVDKATAHMTMDYHPSPDAQHVMTELEAYVARHGEYPQVIIFDNVKNCYFAEGGEFEALEGNCEFMHQLARDTGACVVGLHHVTGDNEDGNKPIPLSGLRGKISKTPEVVLTLHRNETQLLISPVKNRNGKADASGMWALPLNANLSTMTYTDV